MDGSAARNRSSWARLEPACVEAVMALISEHQAGLLRAHFERALESPVRIDLFVEPERRLFRAADECEWCDEALELMTELARLSPKLELVVHTLSAEAETARRLGVERVPAIVLSGAARGSVRFVGMPLGYELTEMLETIVDISRGHADLDAETKTALASLKGEVRLELFVTQSCPHCPSMARLIHKLAIESGRVSADVIEAGQHPELVERYAIEGVPTLVVNGEVALVGLQPEAHLLVDAIRAARAR